MRFIDECSIDVEAGSGGNGAIAFRREKFVPLGGPAGGDGGRGGDVIFVADPGLNTLYDLYYTRRVAANEGAPGEGKDRFGRGGTDTRVRVPLGTIVFDRESGANLGELTQPDQELVIARGGRGGRGNIHFATPIDKAPHKAEPGKPGEKRKLRLELKSMADVGLLGFPNVGKSTLISSVSRAKPKIADYPFTTLEPHLGVVTVGDSRGGLGRHFVIADIPGLLPGASEGTGLGIRFLRHIERTRVLLHLVTITGEPDRDPLQDYQTLRKELGNYSSDLACRTEIVALSKADLPEVAEAYPDLKERFAELNVELHLVSSATHEGLTDLMNCLARVVFE
jgi:GTP-binding protein